MIPCNGIPHFFLSWIPICLVKNLKPSNPSKDPWILSLDCQNHNAQLLSHKILGHYLNELYPVASLSFPLQESSIWILSISGFLFASSHYNLQRVWASASVNPNNLDYSDYSDENWLLSHLLISLRQHMPNTMLNLLLNHKVVHVRAQIPYSLPTKLYHAALFFLSIFLYS